MTFNLNEDLGKTYMAYPVPFAIINHV